MDTVTKADIQNAIDVLVDARVILPEDAGDCAFVTQAIAAFIYSQRIAADIFGF